MELGRGVDGPAKAKLVAVAEVVVRNAVWQQHNADAAEARHEWHEHRSVAARQVIDAHGPEAIVVQQRTVRGRRKTAIGGIELQRGSRHAPVQHFQRRRAEGIEPPPELRNVVRQQRQAEADEGLSYVVAGAPREVRHGLSPRPARPPARGRRRTDPPAAPPFVARKPQARHRARRCRWGDTRNFDPPPRAEESGCRHRLFFRHAEVRRKSSSTWQLSSRPHTLRPRSSDRSTCRAGCRT